MSEEGTITLKNGISLEIKEWIRRREEAGKITEYRKECKDEILNLKKCIKKRTVKKIISPEYEPKFSEVRYLTDEEIVKEYIMAVSDQENKEKKSKAYRILALMKELGGRAVITNVIASGIKDNKRNVSAILSQLRSAGLIDSVKCVDNKSMFLWKINKEANLYSLEQMVIAYNDHIRSVRKKGKSESKVTVNITSKEWKKRNSDSLLGQEKERIEIKEQQEGIKGGDIGGYTKESWNELVEHVRKQDEKELKLETPPTSQIVRVIIEGSIKILIGFDK